MTPTQRSLKLLRERGYYAEIVEHWNQWARRRVDLLGFGDILCLRGDEALMVQTTSGSNASARIAKINGLQTAALWKESPNRKIVVHAWAKRGERGKRKTWSVREIEV